MIIIITIIEKVLSPGGSLRLLAASVPGLGRFLVDKEDLRLVRMRIRMMIEMMMMIMMIMGMVMMMIKVVRIIIIMMFALLYCQDLEDFLLIKRIYNWSGSGS